MQAVLVAKDGTPLKESIAKILDSDKRIQRVDFDPLGKTFNIRQLFAHCFIYVDRSPSQLIINKLRETGCPLILIAEKYYEECCECELFIPIDDFFAPKYLGSFCENILGLRSLYDMEHHQNLSPLILVNKDREQWDRLITSEKPQNVNESTKCKLTPKQELFAQHYYEGSRDGLRDEEIIQKLGIGRSSYYRNLDCLRDLFGVLDNPALALKITTLVERGMLKFGAVNIFSF
jgi:hypothetical protein